MIRYSCADFAFPHLTHENSLKLIKMMGIDAVDIGLFQDRSHIQPSDQLDKPEEKGLLLKQKCADLGLAISDIFMQTSLDFGEVAINHPDAAVRTKQREMFRRLCAAQDADPECNQYPRFKLRDDTCALWGIFEP